MALYTQKFIVPYARDRSRLYLYIKVIMTRQFWKFDPHRLVEMDYLNRFQHIHRNSASRDAAEWQVEKWLTYFVQQREESAPDVPVWMLHTTVFENNIQHWTYLCCWRRHDACFTDSCLSNECEWAAPDDRLVGVVPVLPLGTANWNFPITLTKYLPLNFGLCGFWDIMYK